MDTQAATDGNDDARLRETALRLPRGNAVRETVLGVLDGGKMALEPLFLSLAHRSFCRRRERATAAAGLGRAPLTAEERDAAIGMLRRILVEEQSEPRVESVIKGFEVAFAIMLALSFSIPFALKVAALALTLVSGQGFTRALGDIQSLLLTLAKLFLVLAPLKLAKAFVGRGVGVRSEAARALGAMRATEGMLDVSAALFDRSAKMREASAAALHDLLPAVTPAQYGAFGQATIDNLVRALEHRDAMLAYKVLGALREIGPPTTIPALEKYAKHAPTPGLREAAEDTLSAVRERKRREEEAATLVRAAAGPSAGDALLRPAKGSPDQPAENLLRASEQG